MADISLIEWLVYGGIAYSSLLMLIISTIRDVPTTRALSIIRSIYLMPGMICSAVLAGTGPHITTQFLNTNSTLTAANGTLVSTSVTTNLAGFTISSQVWYLVHWMIFVVLFIYLVSQILIFFTKND